ncbi:hypothetical protein M419DRAFT_4554 [Trichoderma reesei RUT C-30]|uniref:Uncharacterized protein n=1 Tax=Hypocrea jecorina (strain ATCC 56765 / BCRC 32924 / NRRL 11460 / Rut C-30) TaxID=1344414 RepID=A0A024SJP2_HYPJR|nr:hypothetical protein M419DRAFT_4554 [Trichoderma reesei RUT C-30]
MAPRTTWLYFPSNFESGQRAVDLNAVPGYWLISDSSSFNAKLLAPSYGFQNVGDQTRKCSDSFV